MLDLQLLIKEEKPGASEVMNIIGDVSKHHCILVDDIVDSGGTLCNAAEALISAGAISVDAYVTQVCCRDLQCLESLIHL